MGSSCNFLRFFFSGIISDCGCEIVFLVSFLASFMISLTVYFFFSYDENTPGSLILSIEGDMLTRLLLFLRIFLLLLLLGCGF